MTHQDYADAASRAEANSYAFGIPGGLGLFFGVPFLAMCVAFGTIPPLALLATFVFVGMIAFAGQQDARMKHYQRMAALTEQAMAKRRTG